jgi:hypothetical protein
VAKLLKNLNLIIYPFFSSRANSEGADVVAATREVSSPSIGELWPDIDKSDDPPHEDTSVVHARNALIRGKRPAASIENTSKHSRCGGDKDSLTDIARMSNSRSKRHKGGSARREVARILSATPIAISPRMQRSIVDR